MSPSGRFRKVASLSAIVTEIRRSRDGVWHSFAFEVLALMLEEGLIGADRMSTVHFCDSPYRSPYWRNTFPAGAVWAAG